MQVRTLYLNARSVANKILDIEELVTSIAPDIMIITETWLNDSITSSELEMLSYRVAARKDRIDTHNGRGGGVLILANERLQCKEIHTNTPQVCGISVNDVSLYAVYHSPNASDSDRDTLTEFLSNVQSHAIVVGDFNHPNINWKQMYGQSICW